MLKGGTALMLYYNLDRFSEDIDFDTSVDKDINITSDLNIVGHLNIVKDTETTKRYKINLHPDSSNNALFLKIEISRRNKNISRDDLEIKDGIKVYKVEKIIDQKLEALKNRTTSRDLYDVIFLAKNYFDSFNENNKIYLKSLYDNLDTTFNMFYQSFAEDGILKNKFVSVLSDMEYLYNTHFTKLNKEKIDDFLNKQEDVFKKDSNAGQNKGLKR